MFGRKSPEQPSDNFSLTHLESQEDVFASMRARQEDEKRQQAEREAAALAHLPPEERARRQAYAEAMRGIIEEKEDDRRESRRAVYYSYGNRYEREDRLNPLAIQGIIIGVVGTAVVFGPGLIADANYGEERAAQFIEEAGYTDVDLTSKSQVLVSWQGCDSSDAVKYAFEATAANGVDADVIVCKGVFKGATIRD